MWNYLFTLLVWVVVAILLIKFISYASSELRKNKELLEFRANQVNEAIARAEHLSTLVVESENLIIEHQLALVDKMNKNNEFVASHLETIKQLAKSDLIASRRNELARTRELKATLERLVGVSTMSRQPPSPNDIVAIDSLTNRIEELELILADQTI